MISNSNIIVIFCVISNSNIIVNFCGGCSTKFPRKCDKKILKPGIYECKETSFFIGWPVGTELMPKTQENAILS